MKITFLTGNIEKMYLARECLKGVDIDLDITKVDIPEIQEDYNEDVAYNYVVEAAKLVPGNIIKVDSGLCIEGLNGFPGVYSQYVERVLSPEDILSMMKNKENRRAYYKDVLAYKEEGKDPIIFTAFTMGKIAKEPSGEYGYGYDKIFIFEGDDKPMAHFNDEERIIKNTNENWNSLIEYLVANGKVKEKIAG